MWLGLGGAVPGYSMTLEAAFIPQVQQTGSESQPPPHPRSAALSTLVWVSGIVVWGGGKDRGQREDAVEERVDGS